jgi:ATP-dependent Clp protease ATP-binding subunit ClpC
MTSEGSRIRWHDTPQEEDEDRTVESIESEQDSQRIAFQSTPTLNTLGRDITALARRDELNPFFGREKELRSLQRILLRKQKNNPLIMGAAGVGKTALVEGFAMLLVSGEASEGLEEARIVEISPSSLVSGTQYRGTLEEKMEQIIREARSAPNLFLFIDEIHTVVGAGALGEGSLDAADILKPALARGEVRCIGATTLDEADKFLSQDPAFERRFDRLILDEPTAHEAIQILNQVKSSYESHHDVQIEDEAIESCVHLSMRYIHDRYLPDKAFDLLDNACTLVRLPGEEIEIEGNAQGIVNADVVIEALAEKLNIPVQKLNEDEREKMASLEAFLNERVIGQEHAVSQITAAVKRAYAGFNALEGPRHVFAFFGDTGVGKTHTAKALATFLFDTPDAMIRLDMSEFKEEHTISRLLGAPPGYVGYTDEVTFASRLRRRPYSVVLLDEFEKAHPDIFDVFLQIFDEGKFTDRRGRTVDARHALFIITSNLFSAGSYQTEEDYQAASESIRGRLGIYFKAELINRIDDIVVFGTLSEDSLKEIARIQVDALIERLASKGISLSMTPDVLSWVVDRVNVMGGGARAIIRGIERFIADPISEAWIDGKIQEGSSIEVVLDGVDLRFRWSGEGEPGSESEYEA